MKRCLECDSLQTFRHFFLRIVTMLSPLVDWFLRAELPVRWICASGVIQEDPIGWVLEQWLHLAHRTWWIAIIDDVYVMMGKPSIVSRENHHNHYVINVIPFQKTLRRKKNRCIFWKLNYLVGWFSQQASSMSNCQPNRPMVPEEKFEKSGPSTKALVLDPVCRRRPMLHESFFRAAWLRKDKHIQHIHIYMFICLYMRMGMYRRVYIYRYI